MPKISFLGQNIRRLRHELGVSQKRLEFLTGCTVVHHLEAGGAQITGEDTLRRIAQILGVEMHELFMPPRGARREIPKPYEAGLPAMQQALGF